MKKILCILLAVLLLPSLAVAAVAAEFSVDEYAVTDGMGLSWYQGYSPIIQNNTMLLHLPLRAESCVGDITVSIALEDPHVFLLAGQPREVTVSPKDGLYPVELRLPLQRTRRNGDYPATITVKGTDSTGKALVETIPYIIRIRDGRESHEVLEPVISHVAGSLDIGSDGSLNLTITNPTTTQSILSGELTVTDPSGEIFMSGPNRVEVAEILPGKSETVSVPVTVRGDAAVSLHTLEVSFRCQVLGKEVQRTERFTVPVTQAIRLEQGGVQLPAAIPGELANMALPLMNMGKGQLMNVLVKLEAEGVLDAQSVLVGTVGPGETRQAKLTYTPKPGSVGSHPGTVTVTCEDAYGNAFSQTLEVTLTVEEPVPEAQLPQAEEKEQLSVGAVALMVLCASLAAGWTVHALLLTKKLHKLEEEQL